jgi:hypothetical protein
MIYQWIILQEKQETGSANPSIAHTRFFGVWVDQSLVFCLVFCKSLFVFFSFLFWPLLCNVVSSQGRIQDFKLGGGCAVKRCVWYNITWYNLLVAYRNMVVLVLTCSKMGLQGRIHGGARAPPLKLEKIWFFGVKSWFFTRNSPKMLYQTHLTTGDNQNHQLSVSY